MRRIVIHVLSDGEARLDLGGFGRDEVVSILRVSADRLEAAPDEAAVTYAEPLPVEREIASLRAELWRQWEYNHAEHCGEPWPHDGRCGWPLPPALALRRVADALERETGLAEPLLDEAEPRP